MLSLTRKPGEAILIGEKKAFYVEEFQGTKRSCFSKRRATSCALHRWRVRAKPCLFM